MAITTYYTALDSSKSEIRLVHLQPRHVSSTLDLAIPLCKQENIICELVTKSLSETLVYEALSYEWGPQNEPGASFPITINGTVQEVRENLWWALFYLRGDTTRVIWIDALCINQDNITERNQQVSQMSDIYKTASNVVIWLGREHEEVEGIASDKEVFDLMLRVWNATEDPESCPYTPIHSWAEDNRLLAGVVALTRRSYWYRLWIIQEVVLARNKTIQCSSLNLPWSHFALMSHYQIYAWVMKDSLADKLIVMARFPYRDSPTLNLLRDVRKYRCQNVVDKFFGIRAFVAPCCRKAVPVNYSRAPSAVFLSILRHHCLVNQKRKDALRRCLPLAEEFGLELPRAGRDDMTLVMRGLAHFTLAYLLVFVSVMRKHTNNAVSDENQEAYRTSSLTWESMFQWPLFDACGRMTSAFAVEHLTSELKRCDWLQGKTGAWGDKLDTSKI